MLHKIDVVRVYCGPAAIMSITGWSYPDVRSVINKIRGMRDNQGIMRISIKVLEASLSVIGVQIKKVDCDPCNLERLVSQLSNDVRYIIHITGHLITYHNGVIIDNHYRFGTTIDECRWARKHVKHYYEVIEF